MKYLKYIFLILTVIAIQSCVDDELVQAPGEISPETPYTLTFTVEVPPMDDGTVSTRAIYYGNPLYYEDWIDTQNGLRVLFFITKRAKTGASAVPPTYSDDDNFVVIDPTNPLKDYFLFESTTRWVTQLPYDENNKLHYRLTVPLYKIGDEESEYNDHWATIRQYLRDYDFKVAILANHPQDQLSWGVAESVLSASDIDNLSTASKVKTINDIHHSVAETIYTNTNAKRDDAYKMFIDEKNKIDGKATMGPNIGWVVNRSKLYGDALGGVFDDKLTAKTWIRDYWIPDLIYNEDSDPDIEYQTLYHNYRHIWSYWNFGGAAPDNGLPYSDKSIINRNLDDWEERNGAMLRQWINNAVANGGKLTELNTSSNGNRKNDGSMPLIFHPSSSTAKIVEGSNGKRFYGVTLPKLSAAPSSESQTDAFIFDIKGAGTATVRFISSDSKAISIKLNTGTSNPTATSRTINGVKVYEAYMDLDQINNPAKGYIYSTKGDVTVLDVEYTQDRYIYLTDREGILPSSDHPIPMYGVQKFGKLEGWWGEGESFDLTTGGISVDGKEYEKKKISLLRAVAKVEVLVPKSLGVPKHVYLHSLNSTVRCEPMDVATPTELLWKDHNNGCEWKLVQSHGTFYNGGFETNDYKRKLGWYYGNWLEWGWDFNNLQWKPDYNKDGPFPRIFNPCISRSDCAAMIDVTDYFNDEFYHYLFYMGENTIDASSVYNGEGGTNKIPHVEIRFDDRYASTSKVKTNTDLNLMDTDCFRIYFTEKGIASGARDANGASTIEMGSYESKYDVNVSYLKEHWPIMRNHIYRFTVQDVSSDGMNLIVDAQQRGAEITFE